MSTESTGEPDSAGAGQALLQLLVDLDRPDLVERTKAASSRANRTNTIVCVVGEFKQGKSSLVNAMIRAEVCPVDDDLATSVITLIRYGDEPSAVVRRREGKKEVAESVPIDELVNWASEQGNPNNHKEVERVDIAVPSSLLSNGLMLVDTPGMGGLGGGHAAATMAFLPFADGLILVSDAAAELTAPEVDFIEQAIELCPTVMFAQTKTDLYPEWERIFGINAAHLTKRGIDIPAVAVSSHLRTTALRTKQRELNTESKFPELIDTLQTRVVEPAKAAAVYRSAAELSGVNGLLRTGAEEELRLLEDPEMLAAALARLERSQNRLEHLRGPGSRWSTLLNDRVSDVSTAVNHRFRSQMRGIGRTMDETVESLTKGSDWEAVTRDAQTMVSEATAQAYGSASQAYADIHHEVAELLQADDLITLNNDGRTRMAVDLSEFWQGTETLQKDEKGALAGVRSAFGLGQSFGSSKMLFMNMSGLSKFGISLGGLAAGPVVAGGFAVMGGMKLFDDRKKKLTTQKTRARQQIRSFIDNVQFEVGNEISLLIRDIQRDLRDEFMDRIGELHTTFSETAQRAQADAQRSEQEVAQRKASLANSLRIIDQVDGMLHRGAS